jgi:hypothetical protein
MPLGKSGNELVLTANANLTGGLSDSSLTPIQGRGNRGSSRASDLASQARRAGLALKWLEFGRHGARLSSDRRVTLGGLFSALKGTNGPTNSKRQRDAYQGERR